MKITLEVGEVDITPGSTGIEITTSHYYMSLKPYEVLVIVAAMKSVLEQWKSKNPK